ncbi:MAG: YhbY family RNA-binding protein [Bacilli bacterium]|jgi:RNA-binding protein
MLNTKQKAYLKGLAHKLDHSHQLGKLEITPEAIATFDKALTAHELIKIHALKTTVTPLKELALDLAGALKAEIVQLIGKNIILYRANPQDRKIKFPT